MDRSGAGRQGKDTNVREEKKKQRKPRGREALAQCYGWTAHDCVTGSQVPSSRPNHATHSYPGGLIFLLLSVSLLQVSPSKEHRIE